MLIVPLTSGVLSLHTLVYRRLLRGVFVWGSSESRETALKPSTQELQNWKRYLSLATSALISTPSHQGPPAGVAGCC